MSGPDRRLALRLPGVAAAALEGVVPAPAYRQPTAMTVQAASAPLRAAPDGGAEQVDELLFGEAFDVLDAEGVWVFGQARRDGYVGWTPRGGLAPEAPAPTHRVRALRTFAFAAPRGSCLAACPQACRRLEELGLRARTRSGPTRAGSPQHAFLQ